MDGLAQTAVLGSARAGMSQNAILNSNMMYPPRGLTIIRMILRKCVGDPSHSYSAIRMDLRPPRGEDLEDDMVTNKDILDVLIIVKSSIESYISKAEYGKAKQQPD